MSSLPVGYAERAWRMEDADAIASFINAYSMSVWGRESIDAGSLEAQMQIPGVDLAKDTRLFLDADGRIAAAGFAVDLAEPHVQVQSSGFVRQDAQGQGLGTWLAEWIELRATEAKEKAPEGARIVLMQSAYDRDEPAKRLLEGRGYEAVRHFWRMLITLDQDIPQPEWPDGISLQTYQDEIDLRAAFEAGRDAFKDHWGHVDSSGEGGFERFTHRLEADPDIDRSLRFLAIDGDAIAGVCNVSPREGTDQTTGYVELLGVRPEWRKRGIALALLRHAFGEIKARGFQACALHVDSESLTGATRVYEKAGMGISELNHAYELEIRPGKDLTRRSPD